MVGSVPRPSNQMWLNHFPYLNKQFPRSYQCIMFWKHYQHCIGCLWHSNICLSSIFLSFEKPWGERFHGIDFLWMLSMSQLGKVTARLNSTDLLWKWILKLISYIDIEIEIETDICQILNYWNWNWFCSRAFPSCTIFWAFRDVYYLTKI